MIPKGSPHPSDVEQLHAQALNDLRSARRFAVIAPVIFLVLMIAGIWLKFDGFIKNDGHKVPAAILKKAPATLGPIAGLSVKSLERVAPVYQKAIYKVYNRDKAIYARLVSIEANEFVKYAQNMSPKIQDDFKKLSDTVMASLEERLTPGMSMEERIEFRTHAALSLYSLLSKEIEANWQYHVDQVGLTCKQLYSISLTAPEEELEPRYLIGGALELLGLYLQEKPLN